LAGLHRGGEGGHDESEDQEQEVGDVHLDEVNC
jgi:hypothetical protein